MAEDLNKGLNDKIKKAIQKDVNKAILKGFDEKYMDTLKDRIVKRTRLGIGVDLVTGNTMKLPPLAPITKLARQGKARIFGKAGGGKRIFTDGSNVEGLTSAQKAARKKAFQEFFGKPTLASTTSPAKSNVTATGQLLKSLTVVKIKSKAAVKFVIRIGDRRGRDMWGRSSKVGNKQINDFLEAKGFTWFGFTKPQINEIARDIRNFIKKHVGK